jgi:hypothetical protein
MSASRAHYPSQPWKAASSAALYLADKMRDGGNLSTATGILVDAGINRSALMSALTDAVEMARTLHERLDNEANRGRQAKEALAAIDTLEGFIATFNSETIPYHGVVVEWDDPHAIVVDEDLVDCGAEDIDHGSVRSALKRLREAAEYRLQVADNRYALLQATRNTGGTYKPQGVKAGVEREHEKALVQRERDKAAVRLAAGEIAFRVQKLDPKGHPHTRIVGDVVEALLGGTWDVKAVEAARTAREKIEDQQGGSQWFAERPFRGRG